MGTLPPSQIPFPLTSFPGNTSQESGGRLINTYAEPLSDPQRPTGPTKQVWRRSPGLSQLAVTNFNGYRGGLIVQNLAYEAWAGQAATVNAAGIVTPIGAAGSFSGIKKISIARNQASNPDVVAVDPDNGAFILSTSALANAQVTATLGGSVFTSGDSVSLQLLNTGVQGFPVTVTHTLGAGESAATIATALNTAINANTILSNSNVSSTVAGAVLTIKQQGAIGNATQLSAIITGTGNETVTFNPANGFMSGGNGTVGINFTGTPLSFNGNGAMPQANGIAFQDGYMFFTAADGQVTATGINTLTVNSLTNITVQSKSDVTLLRPIPFSGLMFFFTTGGLEVWQDNANPAPAFPYARLVILPFGLLQGNAIAGFETGFDDLMWVSQDYGVYRLTWGSLAPVKISTPDLDRLIEKQFNAGAQLEASVYMFGGKKFWALSTPGGTFEFNLGTSQWNERLSWNPTTNTFGRWRATGGHLAFGKWLMGDTQSGNLLFIDDANFTENGTSQLWRMESGPVRDFPNALRIARADFDFVMGQGFVQGNLMAQITGATAGTNGMVRLAVTSTTRMVSGDIGVVAGVTGTTEANGAWPITVIDAAHIEIPPKFVNTYSAGGTVTDETATTTEINPSVAISCSKDGGRTFDNPSIRFTGQQGKVQRQRVSVKNQGQSSPAGDRWRLDCTDAVYTALMSATQSSDPREYN